MLLKNNSGSFVFLFLAILACALTACADEPDAGLYAEDSNGKIKITSIIIAENGSQRIQDAAEQASRILGIISGSTPEVQKVSSAPANISGVLFIGTIPNLDRELQPELQKLDYGYTVKLGNGYLHIAGTNDYYSYIGIFRFFEKLGSEFYVRPDTLERYFKKRTDLVEMLPVGKELCISKGWSEKPRFLNLDSGDYIAKIRKTSRTAASATHGLASMLLPFEKYGKDHPEYYALSDKGVRTGADGKPVSSLRAHLCLSNKDAQKLAVENLLKWMDSCPKATYFSLGHADSPGWCECENCKKMGTYSERYMRFINMLAEAVKEKHPDKNLMPLAYTPFSEPPPKNIKPAKNVVVEFAPYFWGGARSQAHPLTATVNKVAYKHLNGWFKLLGPEQIVAFEYNRLYWHNLYPCVMLNANIENLKMYAEHNEVKSMVYCGWPYYSMCDLSYYVLDRLLWEPELDSNRLIENFMKAYYGPASPYMKKYYDLVMQTVKTKPHYQPSPYYAPGLLESGLAEKSYPLFAQAEKAVQHDSTLLNRVLLEKGYLLYVDLFERNKSNGREDNSKLLAAKLQVFMKIMVEVLAPDRIKKSGKAPGSWGNPGRGQLAPHLWLKQVCGLEIDGTDIYKSTVIRNLIDSKNPDEFISGHQAGDIPAPAGDVIFKSMNNKKDVIEDGKSIKVVQADTTAKSIWISNPYDARLYLVGKTDNDSPKEEIRIKINGKVARLQKNPFETKWTSTLIQIPAKSLKHGSCDISVEYSGNKNNRGKLFLKNAILVY